MTAATEPSWSGHCGQALGVVKARLLGERAGIDALAAALAATAGVEVVDRSWPRANRYDPP